jgi:ADP-heptose:LPS heptosyltransferase
MKILIIRFSSIGDIVLTTPVIRCAKLQLGAEIHFLTKKSFVSVVQNNIYISKIFAIQEHLDEVKIALQSENYDYVIDLHGNLRSLQVKRFLKAKSFTFDKINIHKWLITNLKINILPNKHIVERYLECLADLGVKNDFVGLDYFIPAKDEVSISDLFGKSIVFSSNYNNVNVKNDENSKNYIAFVIGAAHATKRLPEAKIIEICKKIIQPIVLLGGKDETEIGERIAQKAGIHVINTCGQYNLNQSASIVKQSACVITHDTGLMHIAAAFQKKIVSIWGNTIPEFGMYPYFSKEIKNNISIEVKNVACRPCSKIGHDTCPKGHFNCMNQIDVEAVRLAVESSVVPNLVGIL